MWWTGITDMRAAGFDGFQTVADLRATAFRDVPKVPGVYAILRVASAEPTFLNTSTGGHFKGKNPTVDVAVLQSKWVSAASVVYVGKAGGEGGAATLQSRLKQYLRFGAGEPVGHWGGRYIWQLANADSLVVCWKPTPGELPLAVEQRMLGEFAVACGRLPFANCRH